VDNLSTVVLEPNEPVLAILKVRMARRVGFDACRTPYMVKRRVGSVRERIAQAAIGVARSPVLPTHHPATATRAAIQRGLPAH
jgi:hypothetical protein